MYNNQTTTSQSSPNHALLVCLVKRRHFFKDRNYHLSLTKTSLILSNGPNQKQPKYTLFLNLDIKFSWIIKHNQVIGFILPYQGGIKEFYGKPSDMKYLKEKMGCSIIYENLHNFYTLSEKIEQGAFGKVIKGKCNLSQKQVAIKKLEIQKNSYQIIKNEINILITLQNCFCQNLLEIKEIYKDKEYCFIVTELIEGNNLQQLLSLKKTPFSVQESLYIIENILKGLTSIHQSGIIHRDLKPANIMYFYNKIKIIDFGLSCFQGKQLIQFPNCGTIGYCAPEVLNAQKLNESYNYKADVFSVGCIFYELLTLKKVFPNNLEKPTLYYNQNCIIKIDETGLIFDLVKLFLKDDPQQRLNSYQALQLVQNLIEKKNFDVNTWYKIQFEKEKDKEKQRNSQEDIIFSNFSGLFKF